MSTIHNVLSEVIPKICLVSGVDAIALTGTPTETKLEARDGKATQSWVNVWLNTPIQEFDGNCGIGNTSLLQGLLRYPIYAQEGAELSVESKQIDGKNMPFKLVFSEANGQGSEFILMNPASLPTQVKSSGGEIKYDLTFSPSNENISAFYTLYRLYKDIHTVCSLTTIDGKLIAKIGGEHGTATTHTASVVVADEVTGSFTSSQLLWPMSEFFSIVNHNITDAKKIEINLSSKLKIIMVSVETDIAKYKYYIRCTK